MPQVTVDDLCSTVSTISSAFTEFDDDGGGDVEGYSDPPEMKHVPQSPELMVKTEIPDDLGNATEEDVNDTFIKSYVSSGEDERVERDACRPKGRPDATPAVGKGPRSKMSHEKRREKEIQRKRAYRRRVKEQKDLEELLENSEGDSDDCDRDKDQDWVPVPGEEDEEWVPNKSKKCNTKKVTQKRKRGSSQTEKVKLTPEERRERDMVRKREARLRLKLEKEEQQRRRDLGISEDDYSNSNIKGENGNEKRVNSEDIEENDASSTRAPGSRRNRRIADMTPEQAERERARWRAKREKEKALREAVKSECAADESDASGIKLPGYRKKRVSEMTPEEREAAQARWRLEHQRRRERGENLPLEKIEAVRAKARERQRLKRALAKEGALPEDQLIKLEEQARKDRERKRLKRAAMTPEEKKEWIRKTKMYVKAKRARMTEEEKKAWKDQQYMARMAKLAEMDPEKRRAMLERKREKGREKGKTVYQRLKETIGEEAIRERRRRWYQQMSPEKKAKAQEKMRECYRKKVEALKQDPEKWAEVKQKWKEREKMNKGRKKSGVGEKSGTAGKGRRVGVRAPRKKWSELTEEERDKIRQSKKDFVIKRKLAIQKLLDSGMTMEEIQRQTETPEQREHRCMRKRLNKARMNLRQRLKSCGATPEEIQLKVEELNQTFQPTHALRPYKHQPEKWKPVDPAEIARLAAEGKLDNLEHIKPLAQVLPPKPGPRKRTRRKAKQNLPKPASPPKEITVKQDIFRSQPSSTSTNIPNPQQTSFVSMVTVSSPQQHQQYPHYEAASSSYHQRHSSQPVVFQYPHQQSQLPPQSQSYSLQNVLDAMSYHETTTGGPSTSTAQQSTYQYDHSTSSSQHEYGSGYYDDDNHSPAGSSGGGNFDDSQSNYSSTYKQPATNPSATTTTRPLVKNSSKANKRPRIRKPPASGIRGRGRKANAISDVVCDECGESYTRRSITAHKQQFHNPNYDVQNKKCVICGAAYTHAKRWYDHYNREHVRPYQVPIPKSHVCEECGKGFVSNENLKKHLYFAHGDGLKQENYIRCSHCPNKDKRFKTKVGYHAHLKHHHPALLPPGHDCYRCDMSFTSEKLLGEHVGVDHPSSYFPCTFCTTTRFSQLGLYFHYRRCPKLDNQTRNDMRSKCEGIFCLQEMPIKCEFCKKKVIVSSLSRHYKEMHNVVEDKFTCSECQKVFKTREFWAIHLEEKHQRTVDSMMDILNKLNATDTTGLTLEAVRSQYARPSVGLGKGVKQKDHSWRRRIKKPQNNESDEEEDDEEKYGESDPDDGSDSCPVKVVKKPELVKNKRKRRKVLVIAEEDEMENQDQVKSGIPVA